MIVDPARPLGATVAVAFCPSPPLLEGASYAGTRVGVGPADLHRLRRDLPVADRRAR